MEKVITKKSADKKMAELRERKAKSDSKPRRKPARGSSKPHKLNALDQLALTNAYVLKGKVKKVERDKDGRPTVMIPDVVRKLEEAFAYDMTVEEACNFAGIGRTTYYKFLQDEPDFTHRVEELRTSALLMLRRTFLSDALTNPDNALKYLERKNKKEFSLRTEVAHSGEIVNRHSITPEQEALIKKAMGNFAKKRKELAK